MWLGAVWGLLGVLHAGPPHLLLEQELRICSKDKNQADAGTFQLWALLWERLIGGKR